LEIFSVVPLGNIITLYNLPTFTPNTAKTHHGKIKRPPGVFFLFELFLKWPHVQLTKQKFQEELSRSEFLLGKLIMGPLCGLQKAQKSLTHRGDQ